MYTVEQLLNISDYTMYNCQVRLLFIGMFYYQLGNIKPQLRSILKCIQVIACVTNVNLLKYGYEMVLNKFIEDANKLSEVIKVFICNVMVLSLCL